MAYRDWGYPPDPYHADEALLVYLLVWGCTGAVTATLLLLNRHLLLAFVGVRGDGSCCWTIADAHHRERRS